ncbi:hypothetical protein N2152v2_006142 [Parachlorella kessleri]
MAKWGEGDARWRVDDLGVSGRNVNNWHWVEKDAMEWSKQRLSSLLVGVDLCPAGAPSLHTTSLSKLGGEAVVNNRKKKVIAAYELDVRVDWAGTVDGEEVKGQVRLPYVSEENHDEDPELQVTTSDDSLASRKAKEAILVQGKKVLHEAIATFVRELRAGGPMREGATAAERAQATEPGSQQGQQSTQQQGQEPSGSSAPAAAEKVAGGSETAAAAPSAAKTTGAGSGSQIKLTEKFYASARDIYDCLTDPRRIMAYTQSPAEAQPSPGGKLVMFGGSVQGEFKELQPPNRVVMNWRFSSWEEGCTSQVTITIEEKDKGNTVLKLTQTGIPEQDRFGHHDVVGTTEAGWKNQVFHRIRAVFGYGI